MEDRELIPLKEAQDILGVSHTTMARLVREGRFTIYQNPLDRRQKLVHISEVRAAARPVPVAQEHHEQEEEESQHASAPVRYQFASRVYQKTTNLRPHLSCYDCSTKLIAPTWVRLSSIPRRRRSPPCIPRRPHHRPEGTLFASRERRPDPGTLRRLPPPWPRRRPRIPHHPGWLRRPRAALGQSYLRPFGLWVD